MRERLEYTKEEKEMIKKAKAQAFSYYYNDTLIENAIFTVRRVYNILSERDRNNGTYIIVDGLDGGEV